MNYCSHILTCLSFSVPSFQSLSLVCLFLFVSIHHQSSFSLSLSFFLSHFFPVTNQISCSPYGCCPLWTRMNRRTGGTEVFLCVSVRLRCSYQMFFSVLFFRAPHCLPVTGRYTASVCACICVYFREKVMGSICA